MSEQSDFESDAELLAKTFRAFDEFRRKEVFCDFHLKSGQSSFAVHRIVLAAAFPWFIDHFTEGDHSEEQRTKAERLDVIEQLEPRVVEALIEYAYSAKPCVDQQNVWNLFRAAKCLGHEPIQTKCCDFLLNHLSVDNVLEVLLLADEFQCQRLVTESEMFVAKRFFEVTKSDSRLEQLSASRLLRVISSSPELLATSPNNESTFEAIVRWVKLVETSRVTFLPQILDELDLLKIRPQFLVTRVANEPLIMESTKCRELVEQAKNRQLLALCETLAKTTTGANEPSDVTESVSDVEQQVANKNEVKIIERIGKVIMVNYGEILIRLDLNKRAYSMEFKPLSGIAHCDGLAVFDDTLYHFGRNNVNCVNLNTNLWSCRTKMLSKNHDNHAVLCKDKIYVFFDDHVDQYCPKTNSWIHFTNFSKLTPSCFRAVACENCLYIITTTGVFKYDSIDKRFKRLCQLKLPKSFSVSEFDGKIYICGGLSSSPDSATNVCFMFDPVQKTLKGIASMIESRGRCVLVSHDNKLWAIGGDNLSFLIPTLCLPTECYDPTTNKWQVVDEMAPIKGFLGVIY